MPSMYTYLTTHTMNTPKSVIISKCLLKRICIYLRLAKILASYFNFKFL